MTIEIKLTPQEAEDLINILGGTVEQAGHSRLGRRARYLMFRIANTARVASLNTKVSRFFRFKKENA